MGLPVGSGAVVDPDVALDRVLDCEARIARLQAEQLAWLVAADLITVSRTGSVR